MTHPAFPAFFQFGYETFGYNRLWIHHFFVFHNRLDPIFFSIFIFFGYEKNLIFITENMLSVIFSVIVHLWLEVIFEYLPLRLTYQNWPGQDETDPGKWSFLNHVSFGATNGHQLVVVQVFYINTCAFFLLDARTFFW